MIVSQVGPVLPGLIHQALAHIEHDSTDHAATIRQHLGLP